ncbi:hypothetical protein [Tsukamurella tyrosinosolvens]|nr:hypothetical protein [Tsukamurella tyrosinosolvens]
MADLVPELICRRCWRPVGRDGAGFACYADGECAPPDVFGPGACENCGCYCEENP